METRKSYRLWKIENNTGKTAYLWGSMHETHPATKKFPDEFLQVLQNANSVYLESTRIKPIFFQDLVKDSEISNAKKAIDCLDPTIFNQWIDFFKKTNLAPYVEDMKELSLRNFYPLVMFLVTSVSQKNDSRQLPMDCYIGAEAEKQGKKLDGLEETDRLRLFTMNYTEDELIVKMQNLTKFFFSTQFYFAYFKKNISSLLFELDVESELYLNDALKFTDQKSEATTGIIQVDDESYKLRNATMLNKMKNILQNEANPLFVVGLAHLYGKFGLINELEKDGYVLTPVVNLKDKPHLETLKRQIKPSIIGCGLLLTSLLLFLGNNKQSDFFYSKTIASTLLGVLGEYILLGVWERTNFIFSSKLSFFGKKLAEEKNVLPRNQCGVIVDNESLDTRSFGIELR